MTERTYTPIDRLIGAADEALTTLFASPDGTGRPNPATGVEEGKMTPAERRIAARLMRVNHVGEICAQARYQSQAITARSEHLRQTMTQAAKEEADHLRWCEERIDKLGGRKSLLNPLWYAGSFAIGTLAGLAGDRWNLGFLEETEIQVEGHLNSHLDRLPENDHASRAVVDQMKIDETGHAQKARSAGSTELPSAVKGLMRATSRIMTGTAHWI